VNTAYTCVLLTLCNASADNLNHKVWKVRNSAHSTLHAAGWVAVPLLERLRCQSFSPEVRERAYRLLYRYVNELADRDAKGMATFALPELHAWNSQERVWKWDVRFRRFYEESMGFKDSLRLWIKSQILQRRPLAEILRNLSALNAWGEGN
jgi:hypothetical protein